MTSIFAKRLWWVVGLATVFCHPFPAFAQDCSACSLTNAGVPSISIPPEVPGITAQIAESKTDGPVCSRRDPSLLKDADSSDFGVMFRDGSSTYRLDLTIADVIDQGTLELAKKEPKLNAELVATLGDKPIENFPAWLVKLQEASEKNENAKKVLNRLVVQSYDQKGRAITDKLEVKGLIRRFLRYRGIGVYDNYLNDPEGEAFSRYFAKRKREPFVTPQLTVTKARRFKKELILERRRFYTEYLKMLWQQEGQDASRYQSEVHRIQVVDKSNPKKTDAVRIRVKDGVLDSTETSNGKQWIKERRKTEGWFNAIYSRSDKRELLKYLQIHLKMQKPPVEIPTGELNGERHILLTPSFLYANQRLIEPILKTYNYQKLVIQGDDEHLSRIGKWIRDHFEEVKKATDAKFESNKPTRDEVLSHYEALVSAYPDRPWEPKDVLYDKNDKPVLLVGAPLKALYLIGRGLRELARVENVAAIGTAILVTTTTQNPIAAAYSAAAVRNTIQVLRQGKPLQNAIIPTLIEGALYAIPAAGFVEGQVARAVFFGGVKGFAQSAITGQDLATGALVGSGLELAQLALPARVANLTVGGWNAGSAAANAAIEVVQSAAKGAAQGALTQEITQDGKMTVGEAAGKGALVSASGTATMIAIFGPRMRPISVTNADLQAEKAYQKQFGLKGDYSMDQYQRTPQRWGKYSLRQALSGGDRGLFYGKGVYIPEGNEHNVGLATHEQSHNQQSLQYGGLHFVLDYLVEAFKHGTNGVQSGGSNIFEHYRYRLAR